MDNHTEQFKWDDKLVQDYIQFYAASYAASVAYFNSDETLEKFKQSKSKKEEPQWEILEFKNLRSGIVYIKKDNGKFNSGNGLDWDLEKFDIKDHEIINSVKRFPDNTVWSVDMVTEHGIITAFKIVGSTMVAEIKNNIFPYDYPLYLSELKAPKETPKPEWEILKLEIGGVNYPIDALNEKEKSIAKIYSVKRLSDGEVFSVGDYVNRIGDAGTIHGFQVKEGWSGGIRVYFDTGKIMGTAISEIQKVNPKTAPKEEQVPHRCKYCNALVTSDSDEGCYANPNRINEDIGSEEKQEEQVPIKVEIMEFGYGKPQENKGKFYVANFNLPNNAKLPTEKYQSIKSAIEDVLNEDKIKHEKLLSKIESKVRLANMINTQVNYLKETLDYINSLK